MGAGLVVGGLAHVPALVARRRPLPGHGPEPGDDAVADLTVLAFNTLEVVPAAVLADLVVAHGADVAVLPETTRATAGAAAAVLADRGWPVRCLVADGRRSGPTALLLAERLGPRAVETIPGAMGGLAARAQDPGSPVPLVVAAHPEAPGALRLLAAWRSEGRALVERWRDEPGLVLAGDLNATLDHPWMRRWEPAVDAARAVGRATAGTWPAWAASWWSAPIDHVLVDPRAWRVLSVRVLPATGGSDHRPVLARLRART
ncbi:endonuclease/exonuclease/phosphatase family protein [Cellulomonas marina]|uniref:Uncharacterized conserved protein YafD, endonuclease/exonuclease/phosphatase (EEP) superfamily n=1 Tax=Cellulomonas marina TaxID=988821 RepID=A0A1I0W082_9CELL|nr:endonuclease/exonuclease/phosphatase family protein [Cellulomonas marina]GIG27469.1 hypothetical protein Cma02nite_00690 [Cellulomonas marina]SFA81336.1 Uncharacterized conserved protein YafD, endonuclease/exonuclease/phosphatase (EEP) superfamily [Cellulomonas marina]